LIDLVISGPDMSGTSTQLNFVIEYFKSLGKRIKDIRGTELDAIFHAEVFNEYNENYISLNHFLNDKNIDENKKKDFVYSASKLLEKLNVASMCENEITTSINPDKADVWIMEEPVKRGSGQTNRTLEQNRSKYHSEIDPISASFTHQVYRIDEFYRFRKILRERDKIIIRSRSEESACYQIYDRTNLKNGISKSIYIRLPGNKIAFANPPTHLFIACSENMGSEKYIEMKNMRGELRILDDHEENVAYQVMVNKRYSTEWLDSLYKEACKKYSSNVPNIYKFDMFLPLEEVKTRLYAKLNEILGI